LKATNDSAAGSNGRAMYLSAVTSLMLVLGIATVPGQEKPSSVAATNASPGAGSLIAEPGEFNNSLTLGVGHLFSGGDKAQLMRQLQLPAGTFGGVEELHFEKAIGKKGLFQLDGRGLFDNHDYSLKLDVSQPDIGFVRGGYSQSRTWYDGSGGFSERSNAWVTPYNDEMFVDRGRAWFEGGLALPNWPVLTLLYSYDFREGKKDSTIWGDYNLTQNPANQVLRGIIPTYRGVDEQRHTIDADVKHTIGNTTFGVGVRFERDDIDNSLNILRRYGETNRVRTVTQKDSTDADILTSRAFVETRFSQEVLFTMGGSYTRLDTDIAGSRIYGPSYGSPLDPSYANRQSNDEGFYDLSGGSQVDQYVANMNLMLTPWKQVDIVPSFRVEHQDQSGVSMFTETRVTNAATAFSTQDLLNTRMRSFTDLTEALEVRYTGITNWSLYARAELLEGQGSLKENEFDVEDDGVGPVQMQRDTDSERFVQKYVAGANWYPWRKANFGGQYYYRSRRNTYDNNVDTAFYNPPATNNLYPAFIREHEFNTHDVNFRMTLRPLLNLTLVSRYDFTLTSYNTRGDVNTFGVRLGEIESAQATAHILSQSVSWSPLGQLYVQGSVSYAIQYTDTPASIRSGTASNLVQNAENDYWNANVLVGCVLTRRSDLQAQYSYYRANNYVDNSSVSLPYGAGAESHGATLTLITRLRKDLIWKLQYGYFTGHDQTSGGHNDYHAHLAYSSLQYLF
jgi:hypothetical protein